MSKNKIQFQKGLSVSDFLKEYGTEDQCFHALVKLRWPDGFQCPKCGGQGHCQLKNRRLFQCNSCRGQTSITAGTIYHSTKLPLTKWFLATYLMTQSKSGISQLELARQLGVSANTGAMIYHKLAQVMMEKEAAKPLSGHIEMKEAYWTHHKKKKGKGQRSSKNKTPFVVALEKNNQHHPIYIKLSVVPGFQKKALGKWSQKHLSLGTTVVAHKLRGAKGMEEAGFHVVDEHPNPPTKDPKKTTPFHWVTIILGNIQSALGAIYHRLSKTHMARHLSPFQYRFNHRFILGHMIHHLTSAALRTLPMPKRLLKLADYCW